MYNISHKVTSMGYHVAVSEPNKIGGAGCFTNFLFGTILLAVGEVS